MIYLSPFQKDTCIVIIIFSTSIGIIIEIIIILFIFRK